MNPLGFAVVVGLLVGTWAQVDVLRPLCDSPDVEEAAMAAQDYLNGQHVHGYKYALNRIEDIKILHRANGVDTYVLEIDLLETNCHVMDPTPVANCTVRPKISTAVEGDCDVVLEKIAGVLNVTAFKCKTDESREDECEDQRGDCSDLLPLNHTLALDFVQASLATFNNNTVNKTYTILEVGRMSSQVLLSSIQYSVEYVVVEANCTGNACIPLNDPMAERGFCTATGVKAAHSVDCRMFPAPMMPVVDANSTVAAAPAVPPMVHVHTGSLSHKHGLRHHKLTSLHDPHLSGLLSSESGESAEVVPVVPAVVDAAAPVAGPAATADPAAAADPAPAADPTPAADSLSTSESSNSKEVPLHIFKRDVVAVDALVPVAPPACPGRVRFFS
ncbi:alpha-2-HS-glycoprotein 2 [Hippoglossus stenolepis]|uniref:alpha-2-HS-glycoprotein 2 n=1 Tax=Hippoglossus stenolepis TaxID=195615 RepID=UPI00159C7F35|nr:alpha-2-HS-glycoprotein 2 [Hippoglossus stenolepis]